MNKLKKHFYFAGIWRLVFSLIISISLISINCSQEQEPIYKTERSPLIQPLKWWEKLPRPIFFQLEKVETSQKWFEVYKLIKDTYAIYEPYQFEESISYLVIGEEKAFLIDTGTGIGDLKKLVSELTPLPVAVVNTHIHWDMIGNNSQFNEILIYNSQESIDRLLKGFDNVFLEKNVLGESVWKPLPEGFDPLTWETPPIKPTKLLEDGMILDPGNRPFEVIHSPGHSPDSICLLDKKNRLLFTGDFYYPGPLYAFGEDVNINDYITSLEKLTHRINEFDYLCPGHNEPWVKSPVVPKVLDAFMDIMAGKGSYEEGEDIRRYYFGGFDIIILPEMIK